MSSWPISFDDVLAARGRLAPYLPATPFRRYAPLDAAVGQGIGVFVKHENHNPTNSFKVRNGVSAVTALSTQQRSRGVVSATRGNHGLGVAYASALLGVPATICVPIGNNPEKNAGVRGFGATLIEEGADYEASIAVAQRLVAERGLRLIHSTNDKTIIAGAATMSLEMLEEQPDLDALVISVGGGSQAVGALTVARAKAPRLKVYAVQAAGAAAIHDGWQQKKPVTHEQSRTFADGLATRSSFEMTFNAMCEGLADFITVTDAQIAEALRTLLATTHSLVEGAGAAGLAGLFALRDRLEGQRVGIVLSGGNIDQESLRRVMNREI